MEIVISLGLVIVGGVIGFFIGRHFYGQGPSQESISQAQQDLKAVLSEQTERHVFQSQQLVQNIEKQCSALNQQLEAYQDLLSPTSNSNEDDTVPFFGEHASTYLRNQLDTSDTSKNSSQHDTQPRDFAAAGSGLFTGQTGEGNNKEEGTNSKT
ncbi:DUF1043 family protein [Alteromonas sp. 5E99-2]|uniref:ZapG family protein n=1 Tax=Alteromonas sp. 5E99-2 TaxID=2817683 RepID=UPI001A99F3A0|nr:DUF1043 family protein [Alteromonas sp. 5E99-2]MBO1254284.1 DUF1043 family protein [Alteromonas sp. 5E99-2]